MDPRHDVPSPEASWLDRFRQSWFPPAAIVGAFAMFAASAWRSRPSAPPPRPPVPPSATGTGAALLPVPLPDLPRTYALALTVGNAPSTGAFHRSLTGVATGGDDRIVALGDDEVRVFGADGSRVLAWRAPEEARCLAVGSDGRVYVGSPGRLDVFDAAGRRVGGFPVGEPGKPAIVTALALHHDDVLVGDATARFIRRYDANGRQVAEIGNRNKTRGFILPNRSLDFDVDATGTVHATDSGRHRVASWTLDGDPVGFFGRFSQREPDAFVGCCNPVNLALTPDGKVVTGEKMVARVKVYEPDGTLLALIGPEHFDQQSTHLYLAVDSAGRIVVADPERREIKVFAWS